MSVTLAMFGDNAEIDVFRAFKRSIVYAHEGDDTVVGLGEFLVTLAVDFEQMLILYMSEAAGAHTRSGPVVNLADSHIRHEIYLAEIFSKLGAELEKNFGLALFSLRKKYLPAEQAVALEGRLHPVTVRSRAKLAA